MVASILGAGYITPVVRWGLTHVVDVLPEGLGPARGVFGCVRG